MAATYSLAPNPKWYIADLVGRPLGGGYMATFRSLDKSDPKLVYQDPAGNFPWPYVDIPNVGSEGILFDENGAQGPFYFEFDTVLPQETYYLEIYDSDGVLQWTIDNFSPTGGGGGSIITSVQDIQNLVTNNVFYRNIIATASPIAALATYLAPGAHSGFALTPSNAGPDIFLLKNNLNAIDQITFVPFTLGSTVLTGDVTPAVFLKYVCNNAPTGETLKCIQIPITQNVQNLTNQDVFITIWARSNGGNSNLTLQFRQFFGDGVGASPDVIAPIATQAINANWTKYTFNATVPNVSGKVIGGAHNDALFLQVQYPFGAACDIDITKPSMYLGSVSPDEDYSTNDMIDAVINSPRTGDVTTSFNFSGNNSVPGGYVLADNGTIGNPSSNATSYASFETFPLFNMLWNGVDNLYCPVVDSSGVLVNRGATSIADFNANRAIFIPQALGRVFSGADPSGVNFSRVFTRSGNTIIVNDTSSFNTGDAVSVANTGGSLPSPLAPATTYYVIVVDSTTMELSTTLANAVAGVPFALTTAGSGTNTVISTIPAHALASYQGQDTHASTVAEMPAHNHPGSIVQLASVAVGGGGGAAAFNGGSGAPQPLTIAAEGGSTAHNNLQPTIWANYLFKL